MTERHVQRQQRGLTASEVDFERLRQRALLVGTYQHSYELPEAEASMLELERLVDTAGAETVGAHLQRRDRPDPATFVGSGKAEELVQAGKALDIDLVVFDEELSPAQQRNLEQLFACDVVDRVALILDIFAQHARSQEGMLQVELAQLKYRLPRLRGRGSVLSQQGAGIGTRGPGETALEVDRRRILRRVTILERKLRAVAKTRATQRKARGGTGIPQVAIVGYTNAGKSTLLNRLAASEVLVEDRLFSTLDPTTRRVQTDEFNEVLMTDTVGFLRDLPHGLVEAFTSTLDVVREAHVLMHVFDASAPDPELHFEAVQRVLEEIDANTIPTVMVANKADLATPEQLAWIRARDMQVVSAATGEGMEELLAAIRSHTAATSREVSLLIPYDRGDLIARLHRVGTVRHEDSTPEGIACIVHLPIPELDALSPFLLDRAR